MDKGERLRMSLWSPLENIRLSDNLISSHQLHAVLWVISYCSGSYYHPAFISEITFFNKEKCPAGNYAATHQRKKLLTGYISISQGHTVMTSHNIHCDLVKYSVLTHLYFLCFASPAAQVILRLPRPLLLLQPP